MSAIETLMDEHRVIEQVLTCLERMTDNCTRDKKLDAMSAKEVITFFRTFADGCHHGKEEELLFPALESRGFSPHRGPTAVMRSDHEIGRKLICGMSNAVDAAGAGDEAALAEFAKNARAFIGMLRSHIQKEDHCLFPMARQTLGTDGFDELQREFARVERENQAEQRHDEALQLANRLADRYDVPIAAATSCGCSSDS